MWFGDVFFAHTEVNILVAASRESHKSQPPWPIKSTKESAAAWLLLHVARKFLGTSKFAKPSAPSLSLSYIILHMYALHIVRFKIYFHFPRGLTLADVGPRPMEFHAGLQSAFLFRHVFFFVTANMQHIEISRAFGCIFALKAVPTWIMSQTSSP